MNFRSLLSSLVNTETISPQDLNSLLQDGAPTVVDVNARNSWLKARVPGAVNLDPFSLDQQDLPEKKDTTLVFYCSNIMCRKAPNAARKARSMGYSNVQVMSAGISGWVSRGLPTDSGY